VLRKAGRIQQSERAERGAPAATAPAPERAQWLLPDALALARPVVSALQGALPGRLVGLVGELRRGRELVSQADVLVASSDPEATREIAARMLRADLRVADGDLEGEVDGFPVSVVVVSPIDLGGQSFRRTGSPEVVLAVDVRLAERGLARMPFASERALLTAAGLADLPPECRERAEAVNLASDGQLELIRRADVTAWLHVHTTWSDGAHDLEAMVRAARKLGARVIGISDHSRSAVYARGLTAARLKEQGKAIAALNAKNPDVKVLHGVECDILADGTLDYPPDVLDRLDFVVASIHSDMSQPRATMTARVIRALKHPKVRILAHPTSRVLLSRRGVALDLDTVLAAAAADDVAVEVNANPARLDLDWRHHAQARRLGVKLALGVDAHDANALADVDYGVHILRKGLVPAGQVINTWEPERLVRWLRRG